MNAATPQKIKKAQKAVSLVFSGRLGWLLAPAVFHLLFQIPFICPFLEFPCLLLASQKFSNRARTMIRQVREASRVQHLRKHSPSGLCKHSINIREQAPPQILHSRLLNCLTLILSLPNQASSISSKLKCTTLHYKSPLNSSADHCLSYPGAAPSSLLPKPKSKHIPQPHSLLTPKSNSCPNPAH